MAKFAFIFIISLIVTLVNSKTYDDKYDNIELDQIFASERLLQSYVSCLKDEGPCTPDGSELKRKLPEVLQDGCAKCNEQQKYRGKKMYSFISKNKPEIWKELKAIFDPNNQFETKFNVDDFLIEE